MKKTIIFTALFLLLSSFFIIPSPIEASQQITDWYLKEFHSEIVVNRDSTLDITEKIIADCGNLPNKHGIFRILPTAMFLSSAKKIQTPIDIISVSDLSGNPLPYKKTAYNKIVNKSMNIPPA